MPNDTMLLSVFDYAQQGPLSGGEFPKLPAVFATFVEHFPNSHPPGSEDSADLVTYVNGRLTLAQDKKSLSGEFRVWRNVFDPGTLFVEKSAVGVRSLSFTLGITVGG